MYKNIHAEKVQSFNELIMLLMRLRVIGNLERHVIAGEESEGYQTYTIIKDGYVHEKTAILQQEKLEELFGRLVKENFFIL